MPETFFAELKRYVRFGSEDEAALRALEPHAEPHIARVASEFYERLQEHAEARGVFQSAGQVERLKLTLADWMRLLFHGPWDESYFERRAQIGRVHVRIGLPQRYMFGAMNVIRLALTAVAQEALADHKAERQRAVRALAKILDVELAIMLETYREAFVEKVQTAERQQLVRLEERLALSEAQYREIVEKAWSLVATFDAPGRISLFNGRCEEVTGLTRTVAAGRDWFELFVPLDEQPEVRARCAEALAGGRVRPYEGVVPAAATFRCRVRWHFTTLPTASGPLVCAIGLDVTEERELAVRTRRAERLASLGTMAAGLAHEIRNPLNAAHLQLAVMRRRLSRAAGADLPGAMAAASLVESEMQRLASLVEEFLQFARPQPLRLARVDLRALAESIVDLLSPAAGAAGVDLDVEPGPTVTVEADDERVRQVILNLVKNAVEATGARGRVRVVLEPRDGGGLLEVVDDGPGLASPDAPIFEPFYTTKPDGTGLGLAIVHRIVTDHGGKVNVESRPGRTVFSVFLPGASL